MCCQVCSGLCFALGISTIPQLRTSITRVILSFSIHIVFLCLLPSSESSNAEYHFAHTSIFTPIVRSSWTCAIGTCSTIETGNISELGESPQPSPRSSKIVIVQNPTTFFQSQYQYQFSSSSRSHRPGKYVPRKSKRNRLWSFDLCWAVDGWCKQRGKWKARWNLS